jgi:[protein-PII] uridylyltransferase
MAVADATGGPVSSGRAAPARAYGEARADLLARPGLSGPGRRRALTELTDAWLGDLFRNAGGEELGCSLIAVGGYGRGELSPGSDLDLVLLRPGTASAPDAAKVASDLWYPIWDSGLRLDHSLRTVPEARRVAADDLRALLGMLDVRHLAGDEALSAGLRQAALADWRGFAKKRLPELQASCRERAERAGDLAFSLEPDLKESRGGLRDLVILRAVAASWVADSPHTGLEEARSMLLDVRDALHIATGRASDRLVLQEQDVVAKQLGLLDADALLRQVSGVGRSVAYAADVTWHRVERALTGREGRGRFLRMGSKRLGDRAPLADGVVEQEGEVVLARDVRPWDDPALVLRAAAAAAQAGLRLAPHTLERLVAECPALPEPWPRPALDSLISLLGAGRPAVAVWEALDQAGLTGRLLPDWERVRSRPQRNAVHRFTVDRHLVECAVRAAGFARRVDRPDLLLVGALFHDIGKGWPGDHSEAGVAVVADLGPRLGFEPEDVDILVTLVRHHLLLPDTATRRDLEDPATVAHVAACVKTPDVLDLLHALTGADGLATGPAAWNEWKAGLISDLVARTHAVLGGHEAPPAPVLADAYADLVDAGRLAVTATPVAGGLEVTVVGPDRVGMLASVAGVLSLNRLTVRSASTQTAGSIAIQVWQVLPEYGEPPAQVRLREDVRRALEGSLDVAERLAVREDAAAVRPGVPVPPARVDVLPHASAAATVLEVRAHDRPALLHKIGAALAAAGVDVRSALVTTLGSEAVDVFYVVGPDGEPLSPDRAAGVAAEVKAALR